MMMRRCWILGRVDVQTFRFSLFGFFADYVHFCTHRSPNEQILLALSDFDLGPTQKGCYDIALWLEYALMM
jgi:hypothetical protein